MRRTVAAFLFGAASWLGAQANAREIVDLAGRTVQLPDKIERVGCLEVLCYPRMLMLGASDKIVEMYRTAAPWMNATNPKLQTISSFVGDPNIERLLAQKVNVVFLRYNPEQALAKFASVGIPAVISQPIGRRPNTLENFAADMKDMVRLFGDVLGGKAQSKADEWCAYFDARVRFVSERLDRIPKEKRLRTYYLRGPLSTNTQGKAGATFWLGEMGGADMVVKRASPLAATGLGGVSMEDIIQWDPEVVLVGRQYPLSLVLNDPRWNTIAAVKTKRVYSTPEGVFYWDGGPESMLMMEFVAKTLYPDAFPDLDLAHEIKDYYARFYGYSLSDAEVGKLLHGQSPDGTRFNPMNN